MSPRCCKESKMGRARHQQPGLPGGCRLISYSTLAEVAIEYKHQVFISFGIYNEKALLTSCYIWEKCGTHRISYIRLSGNLVLRKRQLEYFSCDLSVENISKVPSANLNTPVVPRTHLSKDLAYLTWFWVAGPWPCFLRPH